VEQKEILEDDTQEKLRPADRLVSAVITTGKDLGRKKQQGKKESARTKMKSTKRK